jgi:dinuclear metal center YbgI/SA1388 family protein
MLTGMKLAKVIRHLDTLAPEHLAEPWDKVGLQVGDPDQSIRRGLLCIDLTEAVMAEAVRNRCDLIVAYHPPLFEPVQTLTTATWKQRLLREAVRRDIAVYSPHTALDAATDGINDWLIRGLGACDDVQPLRGAEDASDLPHKVVTFVPLAQVDRVREAMAKAGAGGIGRYTRCSFGVVGEGTFQGDATTSPAVGRAGRFERVPEVRLEMQCHREQVGAVLRALMAAHPYEEPAIDVFESLDVKAALDVRLRVGAGRVATLEKAVSLDALAKRVKQRLGVMALELAPPVRGRGTVRRIAVCAGAGGSLLKDAGAIDVFVTGEMRHHDVLDAVQRGVGVILAGHTQTERPYLPTYRGRLLQLTGRAVSWRVSRADRAPSHVGV